MKGGLTNTSNICYANAVIQCLCNLQCFRESLFSMSNNSTIINCIRDTFKTIHIEGKTSNCMQLLNELQTKNGSFNYFTQNDVHEFLVILLDKMHEDICVDLSYIITNDKFLSNLEYNWYVVNQSRYSAILDIFYGMYKNAIRCIRCNNVEVSYETVSNFILYCNEGNKSINDILTNLVSYEDTLVGRHCNKCNCQCDGARKVTLVKLPKVVTFYINRGSVSAVGKNNTEFDVNQHIVIDSYRYELRCVIIHVGNGTGGHYVALCEDKDTSRWYMYNDEVVTLVDPSDVNTNGICMLMYEYKN